MTRRVEFTTGHMSHTGHRELHFVSEFKFIQSLILMIYNLSSLKYWADDLAIYFILFYCSLLPSA